MNSTIEARRRFARRTGPIALAIAGLVWLAAATPGVAALNIPARYKGASADAARVWFQTSEAIPNTGDGDTADDLYERAADGTVRLISDGATLGPIRPLFFEQATATGDRVLFRTREAIAGTGDVDTAWDTYERAADGTLRLITGGTANLDAFITGASADGRRVWFETDEAIPGTGDRDTVRDVYERAADGKLRLISNLGNDDLPASFGDASPHGTRVWWTTAEPFPPAGDSDTARDVYETSVDGTVRLISTGGADLPAYYPIGLAGGKSVLFSTAEALPGTGDADQGLDLYARSYTGGLRLISTSGSSAMARFLDASRDGTRIWFATTEAIPGTGDADPGRDVYARVNGAARLISTSGAATEARFVDASPDGRLVRFQTTEAIPGTGDIDSGLDIYERAGAAVTLATPGNTNAWSEFSAASADGRTLWFKTREAIPGTGDADTAVDIYERRPGSGVRLRSTDTPSADAGFLTASANADRVLFQTTDAIPGTGDTDTTIDLYESSAIGIRLLST
jgi:hypothetical protein